MSRQTIRAWCMYDWANSAFATTVMAALFPPFYRALATSAGLPGSTATAYWGYTAAIALAIIAVVAPVLGAIADHLGARKRFLAGFMAIGVTATACFALIGTDTWLIASALYILGNIGFAGANVFYESLLPHITDSKSIDQVSAKGYALGYLGGGLLLIVNAIWVLRPEWFGMPDTGFAVRASFVSVAVWWALFTIPLLRHVPEPPVEPQRGRARAVWQGVQRLGATFRDITRYRQLAIFLAAFWIYNDGISTVIKMATAYGDEIGIGVGHMTMALVVTQLVGIPFTLLFGRIAKWLGCKRSILLALAVYTGISCAGYFMQTATHFFILAILVGTVQGGSQALSRSLYARMVPPHKAAELFGFFSASAKLAGIAGPLLFATISHTTGQSRLSIVSLIVFFVVGGLLLLCVDEARGEQAARAAEASSRIDD
jgi:UMF1 family MFS transporter